MAATSMHSLDLILVSPQPDMGRAWEDAFAGLPGVSIVHGLFEDLPAFDCMVSAANSFGLMDGGVDAAIARFFGPGLMPAIQEHILARYLGEQPVGTSFLASTGHPGHPFVAHTPTMRAPMDISRTDNVYLAMRAMLLAIHHHNRDTDRPIRSVACPGLGTGVGQVPAREAARQMALAYRSVLSPPSRLDWELASSRQKEIRYGGNAGFLIPPSP